MAERDALLMRSGILREEQADAVFGIVNGEGKLVACGNCRGCSLRCIAVDESCRGEDMLSTLVSAMLEYQFMRGISHVFICTKAKNAPVFAGIGFYEVARAGDAAAAGVCHQAGACLCPGDRIPAISDDQPTARRTGGF